LIGHPLLHAIIMKLNINLNKKDINSYTAFTLGGMFLVVGIYFFLQSGKDEKGFDGFDWAYLIFFAVLGLAFMMKGFGVAFRKAFVKIDEVKISLKPDLNSKVQTIYWDNIQSIQEITIRYIINLKNGETDEIILAHFSLDVSDQIKETIEQIANEKQIPINIF